MTTIPSDARLRGMATCVYFADDLDAAKQWDLAGPAVVFDVWPGAA